MGLLIELIEGFVTILTLLIVVRTFWSWVSPYPTNQAMRLVWKMTEPVLAPVRAILPNFGGIDLSPMAAILLLQGVQYVLVRLAVGP
jgi:YggT family protein